MTMRIPPQSPLPGFSRPLLLKLRKFGPKLHLMQSRALRLKLILALEVS
ncbi:hypothetical protein Goari_003213 [Gossypium aridum]|uniref:Uncharacterized protein n=1 Tax=Gossypium aridum TaxID=34290 RepID=A0A7J8YAS1_GOSAI|nr:hypothetical protein [Gossypium aridum]